MAEGKRYYWLKLHEDFFDSKRIKKLRKQAGGDTYTIIYLKMQLLALKTDGVLTWSGLEENFAEELALDLDEETDDVEVTLLYLLKTGLAETKDNVNFLLPWVLENTGSETSAAKRMRDMRERNKVTPDRNNVTQLLRERYGEKEIEKEIEKEPDLTETNVSVCRTKDVRRIMEAWNSLGLQQLREIKGDTKRGGMLRARVNEYGVDAVQEAIENIRKSAFLKGQNSKGWTITFEWFVAPNNFIKVLEGNYDDTKAPAPQPAGKPQKRSQMMTAEEYNSKPQTIDKDKLDAVRAAFGME